MKNYGIHYHYNDHFFEPAIRYSGINMIQLGELSCEGEYFCAMHRQVCHEISYIISGEGYFTLDGVRSPVAEGDIYVCLKDQEHEIYVAPGQTLRYAFWGFNFNEDAVGPAFDSLKTFFSPPLRYKQTQDTSGIFYPFIRCVDEYYRQNDGYHMMIEAYIKQMLIMVQRTFVKQPSRLRVDEYRDSVGATVYSVVRYIEDHIFDELTVSDIVKELGYSHSYMSALFRKKMGTTIQRFIQTKKIEKAVDLLNHSGMTITEAAHKLCFANVQSFSRTFSKVKLMSPSRYMQALGESQKAMLKNATP